MDKIIVNFWNGNWEIVFELWSLSILFVLQDHCFIELHQSCLASWSKLVITSAEEGGYVFGSVCLSVCPSDYSQTCERILAKFFVGVGHGSWTK